MNAAAINWDTAEPPQVPMTGTAATFDRLPGGGYRFALPAEGVAVEARYLRRDGHQLHAELDVSCTWHGAKRYGDSLSCADANLSSQTARKSLAKHCAERAQSGTEFDWLGTLDAACLSIIRAERAGDDVVVLDDVEDAADRDVEVVPGLDVPTDGPAMLFATGGTLKSLILLYVLGILAQRGWPVLFLDWEWTAARHKARKQKLFGLERLPNLHYMNCRQAPLEHQVDRIRRRCDELGIRYLAVDSVGLAAAGKLIDDDTAIRFYRALASLPPALCAAHVAKGTLNPDTKQDASPFGSIFFSNLARMTWHLKKQEDEDAKDRVVVGLYPAKQNDGARQVPVGFEVTFAGTQWPVRRVDLADVEGLSSKLSLQHRMRHALKSKPKSYAELADELGAKVNSVEKAAKRSNAFTKVSSGDGVYRLALVSTRSDMSEDRSGHVR